MFEVGFSEVIVIVVVALIVIGPEKLPKIARTYGLLYGRVQRYISGVKHDIDRQVALDTMRKATADAQQKLLALQATVALHHEIEDIALSPESSTSDVSAMLPEARIWTTHGFVDT